MAFYDLPKEERKELVQHIHQQLLSELQKKKHTKHRQYFADDDTYVRKAAYLAVGRIYFADKSLQHVVLSQLNQLYKEKLHSIRQTVVNAAGEIGMKDFGIVEHFFDTALFDEHHTVRNAVIGSVKKMGQKNPKPIMRWSKKYLHHPDKEVRREICHGIELRGRTHPQDILPLLKELQFDTTARVKNTLIHVLGQIAYKKGCLATVIDHLKTWENEEVVHKAIAEIIDVHDRYKDFAVLTQRQAKEYIKQHFH